MCLLYGCSTNPSERAIREERIEIARRIAEGTPPAPKLTLAERKIATGEAALMERWAERLSGERAGSELTHELARRTAELTTEDRMLATTETTDQRETRLATRERLRELHDELLALRTVARAKHPGAPPPGAEYGLEPNKLLDEIEGLSRARARTEYLRERAADEARCRRALDAALSLERAERGK